jgi:TonB family protein
VSRTDGHMQLANSLALTAAKVTKDTPDPAGGRIIKRADGEPTGILKDNAMSLVDDVIPDPPAELADRALDAAMRYVASNGVTSVHNMGYSWWDLEVFERAHKGGRLITRIYAVAPLRTWAQLRDTVAARGRGDDWLHIGGLKGFVDGSAGSHTALMLRPFADAPKDSGLWVTPAESLYAWTSAADKAGLQVMVHAIGDRAIRTQLDIYARVAKENGPRDRRFRIEHAQHPDSAEIPRFAQLDVIASMQPYHAIDDGRWMDSVIGPDRTKFTYAFRGLLDAKARLAFGSDWSVAPATPLEGIYAATTRRTLDNKHPEGWVPAQKITVEEALRAYTSGAAYAEFKEWDKGTIEVGKLADLVVLDCDLTKINPATIRNARIMATIVGGNVVYEHSPGPFIAYEEWQVQQPALERPGNPAPRYPAKLEAARVEGSVKVRVVVDTLGRADMSTFRLLKSTNDHFTNSILAILPRMRFTPAQLDGHAVSQWVDLPFDFRVHH